MSKPKTCTKCGTTFQGETALCSSCTSANRVVELVQERIRSGDTGSGPVCPFCRAEITWENVGTLETEITIYVREKIYFCPSCRAFLGVSSWHSEG